MRRIAVLTLAFVLWASPAAGDIDPDAGQAPCVIVSKHNVSDAKARRRCDLPDGTVSRSYKQNRVIVFVI